MNDTKIKSKCNPIVYLIFFIITPTLVAAYLGILKGISIGREIACIAIVLLPLVFCGVLITRHYRLSEEGLHVYWYGIVHTLYRWDDFPVRHVFYMDLSTGCRFPGNYIIFSSRKRLLETNGKHAFLLAFSTFTFEYTPELYAKFKRYCPDLTNHSAREADI